MSDFENSLKAEETRANGGGGEDGEGGRGRRKSVGGADPLAWDVFERDLPQHKQTIRSMLQVQPATIGRLCAVMCSHTHILHADAVIDID